MSLNNTICALAYNDVRFSPLFPLIVADYTHALSPCMCLTLTVTADDEAVLVAVVQAVVGALACKHITKYTSLYSHTQINAHN